MAELIGRDAELAAVAEFLDTAAGEAAALVIEGEAGIGKTAVWSLAVGQARQRGVRVLEARPAASEQALSYASFADLLAEIDDDLLVRLPDPQRVAVEAALLRTRLARAPNQRAIFTAFLSLLSLEAERAPVLLAIDDMQWLDAASERALAFVVRRMARVPVGFLGVVRAEAAVNAPGVVDALEETQARRIELAPLSLAGTFALIKSRLDVTLPRPALVRLHQACRGNPFYALEIARALVRAGARTSEPLPVPNDIRHLVAARVRRLPVETQTALLVAASLSRPTTADVDDAGLRKAADTGLLTIERGGRVRFAHPLYASAIYADAPHEQRRALHRTLARQVEDIEERARHLALASEGESAEVAAVLEAAAAQASGRGAPDVAADLLDHAVSLTPRDDLATAHRRRLAAAEEFFRAGDAERARALATDVVDEPDSASARASAMRLLGEISAHQTSFAESIAFLSGALEHAGDDNELRTRCETMLAFAFTMVGDVGSGRAAGRRGVAAASGLDDGMLAVALAAEAATAFANGEGLDEEQLERAAALEDPDLPIPAELRPTTIRAALSIHAGQLERGRVLYEAFVREMSDRGEANEAGIAVANLAWVDCVAGRLDVAAQHAQEAIERARQVDSKTFGAFAVSMQAFVAAHAGDEQSVRDAVRETAELLEGTQYYSPRIFAAAAEAGLELSLGNPAAAQAVLEPLTAMIEAHGLPEPAYAFFLPDALEALIALGELERAETLTALLEERGRVLGRTAAEAAGARCRALSLAASGDLDAALTAADRGVALHAQTGMPLELARTLLVKGQIERRRRAKAAARESLERAVALCEQIGARLWAERVRRESARVAPRHEEGSDLTPTEARVAELAASGLTNRKIAERLFVSPKTVEANLARIYAKLGIRSRAELGARVGTPV